MEKIGGGLILNSYQEGYGVEILAQALTLLGYSKSYRNPEVLGKNNIPPRLVLYTFINTFPHRYCF